MCENISEENQEKLYKLFVAGAAGIEIEEEHWAHGGDGGLSFCYDCCEKEVARIKKEDSENAENCYVDGGWGTEGDSIPYCETCGKMLANSLTGYGCEEEVDHFLEYGFDLKSESDCYSMELVIDGRDWKPWSGRRYRNEAEKSEADLYYRKLHKLCRRILEKEGV